MEQLIPILVAVVALVLLALGVFALLARFYRQVDQGKALIVNTLKSDPLVTFTGAIVYPIIHRAEVMDISVKTIEIDRRGKEGLICKDNIRGDIKVTFFVRVNKTHEDVLKVAQAIGCVRASDQATVEGLFEAKFAEALKTVGKRMNFEDLYKERDHFKDAIIEVIGKDLNGFVMDDCAIDYLEQTPIESLDQNNIMDAEGIRKITDLTVTQNLKTNELRQKERMETGSQNLAGDEAVFRFEQKRSEAEARKNKEVSIAQSREQNEAQRIANEEAKRTLLAHEKNSEETLVAQQARERAVLVAMKNKEREIAVEVERVERARQMEVTTREADVVAQQITRQAEIERQKREIAEVVRGRIAVDKTVAEEEERIKDVRAIAEASRHRDTLKITAEGEAAQLTTRQVKAAEAAEEVAKAQARQRLVLADADLEVADKHSRAKVRLAEGTQAEASAAGLAAARVREADAKALELTGAAEASSIRAKMSAEASGIGEKAEAMKALDGVSRQHEEFRLQLEQQKVIALESIRAKKDVAGVQAEVLKAAFENAKINIVGGDGAFFERFIRAVTVGQSIDGAVDQSEVLKGLMTQLGTAVGEDASKD
ncbi:MAG: hypothetical protein Q8S73_23320 [Deltaproteobacteria bacterium]|nr:hypothetical protein [Myxococcales bacterium]MDP3217061.1 hypothetical protein [Deltaproteobacteria bacterium]